MPAADPDRPVRVWGRREAALAWLLVAASGFGALRMGYQPIKFPFSGLIFLGLLTVAVLVGWKCGMSDGRSRAPRVVGWLWLLAAVGGLVAWYIHFQPIYGPQSDNADALERGAREIMAGRNPYLVVSKFGGPLSPLLGGLLMALPLTAAFGAVWVQQLLSLAAGAVASAWSSGVRAAAVAATLFLVSPWSRLALPNESDHWIIALLLVITSTWGWSRARRDRPGILFWLTAVAFGFALCDRFVMGVVVVPLVVAFWRTVGPRRTLAWMGTAGVVAGTLLLIPFAWGVQPYLHGPLAIGASHAGRTVIPHSGLVVAAVALLVVIVGSLKVRSLIGAWTVVAVSLAVMIGVLFLGMLPAVGLREALTAYDTVAFNGTWLVFGLAALTLPPTVGERALP